MTPLSFITRIVTIALFSISMFGAIAMTVMDTAHSHPCLFPLGDTVCPMQVNVFNALEHHMSGIQAVAEAVPAVPFSFVTFLVTAGALLLLPLQRTVSLFVLVRYTRYLIRLQERYDRRSLRSRPVLRWFIRIYSLDPYTFPRVHDEHHRLYSVRDALLLA